MAERDLRPRIDVADSSWIEPRLTGGPRAITRQVPSGYARYVRICHPVEDRDGTWVSWSTVGESTGRHPHALMQWHALVGSAELIEAIIRDRRFDAWPMKPGDSLVFDADLVNEIT